MPYTNEWSNILPLSSDQVRNGDDHMRRIRLDVYERMNTLFDWEADPITFRTDDLFPLASRKIYVHGSAFVVDPGEEGTYDYSDTGVRVSNTVESARAAVQGIVPGSTIIGLRALLTNGDTAAIAVALKSLAFVSGLGVSTEASFDSTTSGIHTASSGVVSVLVGPAKAYFLSIDKTGGAEFEIHSVEIEYSTPNILVR